MSNELATLDTNQWEVMKQQAKMLVNTGFLPDAIKTPEQAVAIMLTGRELGLPTMYALNNIAVIKGKPAANAAVMLSLIYRDHGDDAAKWDDDATNDKVATLLYKRRTWTEYKRHTFTIEDARTAGLAGNATWKLYPGAMLRARCISAVARMAFPDSIGGMYTPEELGMQIVAEDSISEARRVPVSSYVPDDEPTVDIAEADYDAITEFHGTGADDEILPDDDSDFDEDDGLSPIDELLARTYAATTLDDLEAIRKEKNDNGIDDEALADAWRTRFKELGGTAHAPKVKQPALVGAAAGEPGNDRHSN
jgi:hypothetical protein